MALWMPYFFTVFIIGIFALSVPNSENTFIGECNCIRNGSKEKKYIFILSIILVSFCAFKMVSAPSIDEYAYRNRFNIYSYMSFSNAMKVCDGEYINGILVWLSTRIFQSDQGIFIVFNTLTVLFYLGAIKKYCRDYAFAVVLLMVMGIINTSFNITQQSLAVAIFVYYSSCIYERKLWKFILLVSCCYFIHRASIILPLFYFLGSERFSVRKNNVCILFGAFVLAYLYSKISYLAQIFPMLEQYGTIYEEGHEGVRMVTIAINCVPAVLAFLYTNHINPDDKITALSANMCIANAAIYIVCIMDRYIARLAMFTAPFCIIFMSRSIDLFGRRESVRLYKFLVITLYSIVLYLQIKGYTYTFNFSI